MCIRDRIFSMKDVVNEQAEPHKIFRLITRLSLQMCIRDRYFISLLFFGALILLFYRCPFKMITGIDLSLIHLLYGR